MTRTCASASSAPAPAGWRCCWRCSTACARNCAPAAAATITSRYALFSNTGEILNGHNARARARVRTRAARAAMCRCSRATRRRRSRPGRLVTADGTEHALDEILWVTAAGAAAWLAGSGLQRGCAGVHRGERRVAVAVASVGVRGRRHRRGAEPSAAQVRRVRRAPGPAAGGQSAAGPARPGAAPVPSAAPVPQPDHHRRQIRRGLARRLGAGRPADVALEGPDRPPLHAQIQRAAGHGAGRAAGGGQRRGRCRRDPGRSPPSPCAAAAAARRSAARFSTARWAGFSRSAGRIS